MGVPVSARTKMWVSRIAACESTIAVEERLSEADWGESALPRRGSRVRRVEEGQGWAVRAEL